MNNFKSREEQEIYSYQGRDVLHTCLCRIFTPIWHASM